MGEKMGTPYKKMRIRSIFPFFHTIWGQIIQPCRLIN